MNRPLADLGRALVMEMTDCSAVSVVGGLPASTLMLPMVAPIGEQQETSFRRRTAGPSATPCPGRVHDVHGRSLEAKTAVRRDGRRVVTVHVEHGRGQAPLLQVVQPEEGHGPAEP